MLRQVGLDNGKESLPLYLQPESAGLSGRVFDPVALISPNGLRLASGKLALLDEIYVQPNGGSYGKGYIFASRAINPQDWYFKNHFYQDPVMPGSLGIEAILEALGAYAISQGLDAGLGHPHFGLVEDLPFIWKYRGQILPASGDMRLEVHVRQVESRPGGMILLGDASLWAGNIRIYQVKNAALRIAEGR
jgi:3-hydroxymyristoyl/3-hydroxydecanoyl-(acyl carrier protein) dehydratase